jgi:glycosyltransferase involved in cell wall biosynthesis
MGVLKKLLVGGVNAGRHRSLPFHVLGVTNRPHGFAGNNLIKRAFFARAQHLVSENIVRIAQIAPLVESVPPKLYGGTERIVSYLTDELVRCGHEVTLFASADSVSAARLVSCAPRALRLDHTIRDPIPYYLLMLNRVQQQVDDFDILHFHIDNLHFPLFRRSAARTVTTLHGRQDLADLKPLYVEFTDMPLVSISNSQRMPVASANFVATVYHGIPTDFYQPVFEPRGGYLAFIGRVSPEKGVDNAIEIARAIGIPLKIAAKVDKTDEEYFRERIAPLLEQPGVDFIGEISEREKSAFLGEARALLFPIVWPEPFGLALIEAMACGTPVLAFRNGAVEELVDEGVTGLIADSIEDAIRKLPHLMTLDRHAVRRRFEVRFSVARMAKDYIALYRKLCGAPLEDSNVGGWSPTPESKMQSWGRHGGRSGNGSR